MNFIKAKLFMILCLGVVALGMGLFVVGFLIARGNADKRQEIQVLCNEVMGLTNQLVRDGEIEYLRKVEESYKQDVEDVKRRAQETTARSFLHPEVMALSAGPERFGHYQKFADRYIQFIEGLVARMAAGNKLSLEEEERISRQYLGTTLSAGAAAMGTEASAKQDRALKLIAEERKKRARSIAVYATSELFCNYEHWKRLPRADNHEVMLTDIWYTQLAAWIQEDIVEAVKQINGDSSSVFSSPVKRLVGIYFGGSSPAGQPTLSTGGTVGGVAPAGGGGSLGAEQNRLPCYVIAPALAGLADPAAMGTGDVGVGAMGPPGTGTATGTDPFALTGQPATGPLVGSMSPSFFTPRHVSDSLVDVVHFELAVVVDSSRIHDFINVLQSEKYTVEQQPDGRVVQKTERNQITVLQIQITPVNIAEENAAGYYYGDASVKSLRLLCQYIFFRKGYQEFMPPSVRSQLGIAAAGG